MRGMDLQFTPIRLERTPAGSRPTASGPAIIRAHFKSPRKPFMSNRTFTIIKPDSVRKGNFGKIISRLEAEGFRVLGLKRVSLGRKQAEGFYAVHRERPFFPSLVESMTSVPVFVAALERDNAVAHLR